MLSLIVAIYAFSVFFIVSSASNVSVALLQMLPSNNTEENILIADRYCRQAADMGADIALMPEMWNIGYSILFPGYNALNEQPVRDWLELAVDRTSSYVAHFRALALELNMAIGVTYLEKHANGTLPPKNSITLIDRFGHEILHYSKVHTCDFTALEGLTYPGDTFYVATLTTIMNVTLNVGAMICYDREQPESARILMLQGAELILIPNACFFDPIRLAQLQVRAFENALVTAMANYPAPLHNGWSSGYDVDGHLLNTTNDQAGIVMISFNVTRTREYRTTTIFGDAFRRPQRYGELIKFQKLSDFKATNFYGRNRLF
jgi:predicted amidohydrolase